MSKNVLEYRPAEAVPVIPVNNPVNNFFIAFVHYIDSIVDSKVNEQVEKRLGEFSQPREVRQEPQDTKLIKARQLGVHLGFAESTINSMAERGEIPCTKHTRGKKTFRRFDLDEVLEVMRNKS